VSRLLIPYTQLGVKSAGISDREFRNFSDTVRSWLGYDYVRTGNVHLSLDRLALVASWTNDKRRTPTTKVEFERQTTKGERLTTK